MANLPLPARDCVEAQREMFRLAERECGLSIKAIARRSPLSASTMEGWRNGAAMPAWAIGALGDAGVPDHILSVVLDPYARHVSTNGNDDTLEELADASREFVHAHDKARSPASPGGIQIVPQERAEIVPFARKVKGKARRVSA
ncbi:hypothetical protein UFOVP407_39 [uncultured Caudovirales phage]|uniref:Uncharacterized protein n=1 Tax=uncultured Caudovirales phage TaxID=2100421 RepID=A0A6J5M3Y2_9CAUD|nr:hypothetical protein UFOVP407_39 [uncultured Caudovirales phage]